MAILNKDIVINYTEYNSISDLRESDQKLLSMAIEATNNAYAPYSKFNVGAAIELDNGIFITGNNQENIAYPSGLCAERVALYSASANYPNVAIKTIAVAAKNNNQIVAVSPCGSCRQVLAEYENLSKTPIRILFFGEQGKIYLFTGINSLLPMQFSF